MFANTPTVLFAEVNWGQGFTYGLIGGGAALAVMGIIQIFKAMQVNYDERAQVEANQPLLIGYIVLGIIMIGGGVFLKQQINGPSEVKNLADFIEFHSKEGGFKASFPHKPKEQTKG